LGCFASATTKALFSEVFDPVQKWLDENDDFDLWLEYKEPYAYWNKEVGGGLMDYLLHLDIVDKYRPRDLPAPVHECSDEDLESKVEELSALSGYEYSDPLAPTAPTAPTAIRAPVEDPEPPKPPHMVFGNHRMTREECNAYCSLGPFTEEEWDMLLCGEYQITEADLCRLLNKPFSTVCMINTAHYDFFEVDPTTYPPETPVHCPPQCPACHSSSSCKLTVADFYKNFDPSIPAAASITTGGGAGYEEEDDDTPVPCPRNCGDCGGLRYGCGLTRGDIRRMYSTPEPEPTPEDDCVTPPPYHIRWEHHKRTAQPHEFPTICSDTRTVKSLSAASAELVQYTTVGYYSWKEKHSLDYFRIFNARGKELHLDELPPLILTASRDRDLGLRAEQPPRPTLKASDIARVSEELIPTLTDDEFPLRIEFFHREEEWHDSLLLVLNIATEKARSECRKNAIEEANHRERLRECYDHDDSHDW